MHVVSTLLVITCVFLTLVCTYKVKVTVCLSDSVQLSLCPLNIRYVKSYGNQTFHTKRHVVIHIWVAQNDTSNGCLAP